MVDETTYIYVGTMERILYDSADESRRFVCAHNSGKGTVTVNVSFDVETDTIHEEIMKYDNTMDMDGITIEREYWLHNWQHDVVEQYTEFITSNILILRGIKE